MSNVRVVEVQRKSGKGFGFSIIGGSDTHLPPMICSVVQDSPAYKTKKIYVGDVLENVNGISTRNLTNKAIAQLIQNSEVKVELSLRKDQQAKALAKPFLTEDCCEATTKISFKAAIRPPNLTGINKRSNSPGYERTVGSPEYDHYGTDGKFASTGSLDRSPVELNIDDVIHEREDQSSNNLEIEKDDNISDKVDFNITDKTSEVAERLRLGSNPIFGSAPRLHVDANDEIMRQISGHPISAQHTNGVVHTPSNHRRSLSQGEQSWQYGHGQQQPLNAASHYRAVDYQRTGNSHRNAPSASYFEYTRETGQSKPVNDGQSLTWSKNNHYYNKPNQAQNGGFYLNSKGSHSEEKLPNVSAAQDLRNAYLRHQIAMQKYKQADYSHRRHKSDELQLQNDNAIMPQRNGPVTSYANERQQHLASPRSLDRFIDDEYEEELQRSGYGAGFHRTNSLGRADMYKRHSGHKAYHFVDKAHQNRYQNSSNDNEQKFYSDSRPMLSQSVQDRLKEIPMTKMINRDNVSNYDWYQCNQSSMNQPVSYITDQRNTNGVVMRDYEDGVAHSRFNHGKSLAVPIQQANYQDEYFQSFTQSGDMSAGPDRNPGMITSRSSMTSRASDSDFTEILQPNVVPDELKSFDATDLATKLFTLEGFTRDDVAPFLGKNTEFSQQVCREYMKFMNFEGYSLDEALRILLQKFPLTGETQERERILMQFSKRYYESNKPTYGSEDAVHTLTCALMLLNTDLHGQNIFTKMTLNDFINNLSGMCDGKDFSRDFLKTLYLSIKNKEMLYAESEQQKEVQSKSKLRKQPSGNPFIELKANDDAVMMREGMMYRKCIMETDGRRLPAMKRGWKMFYCLLKGLVLFLHKPDKSPSDQSIGIHHSLAGFATEYKKRPFVFKLITADWRVFMFQAKSKTDVQNWVDAINLSAAALSSPPLPAPCSSSKQFSRPVMPVSVTRLDLEEQIRRHQERTEKIDKDMQEHREIQPDESSKDFKDWENKMDYLEFEYKRFSAYAKVLCSSRLKESLNFLLSKRSKQNLPKSSGSLTAKPHRSNSLNDIGMAASPAHRRRVRQSYLKAVYS